MSGPSLAIDVFGARFQNPILLAAGTAGMGREVAGVIDLDALGGLVTKAVSVEPRAGNPPPRVAETRGGMLNSVGLANPGLASFRRDFLPWLEMHVRRARVLVNVVGHTTDDFVAVVSALAEEAAITAFELNVSCPNVEAGGVEFGADARTLADLVRRARTVTKKPLIIKLSPVLADPGGTAERAVEAGADGFTTVNTLPALLYEDEDARPRLGGGMGGLSGPALLPVGLRFTRLVARASGKPVIGMGGVRTGRDALQYLEAGASLVGVGTAALADPRAPERIVRELARILSGRGVPSAREVIGTGMDARSSGGSPAATPGAPAGL